MKFFTSGSLIAALVLSLGTAQPAKAGDVALGIAAIKLLTLGALASGRNAGRGLTSNNTQYALTGKGRPYLSNGQLAGAPHRGPAKIICNAHGTHCRKVHVQHGW